MKAAQQSQIPRERPVDRGVKNVENGRVKVEKNATKRMHKGKKNPQKKGSPPEEEGNRYA